MASKHRVRSASFAFFVLIAAAPLTPSTVQMNAKTIRLLSFLGKAAGLVLVIAGPAQATPAGLIVFAAASFLKDAVNRLGDILDEGNPNDSIKP